jgi:hypothetical protein
MGILHADFQAKYAGGGVQIAHLETGFRIVSTTGARLEVDGSADVFEIAGILHVLSSTGVASREGAIG